MEEIVFSSKEELFKRVKPALMAKMAELHRLGYPYISDIDVWNYLIKTKWSMSKDLMLSDVVSDILHVDNYKIDEFLKGKLQKTKRTEYFSNNLEIV